VREAAKNGESPKDPQVLEIALTLVRQEIMDQEFRMAFSLSQYRHLTQECARLEVLKDQKN
jgi:hypothetical protein